MTFALLLTISIVVGAAVYLMLSRDIFRMVVGLSMLSAAVNLIVFAAGRFGSTTPPLRLSATDSAAAASSDPLVQALVLTAIVIGFALLCFALVLGARLRRILDSDDSRRMRTTEPPAGDGAKPLELDD